MSDDLLREAGLLSSRSQGSIALKKIVSSNQTELGPTLGRWREFDSPMAAILSAIASSPSARAALEARMSSLWSSRSGLNPARDAPDVVIGSGIHAAIYCAARVRAGYPRPLVLEESSRVGGAFAVSEKPSFWLNSRNRPGPIGVPGRNEALNVMPAAPVQLSDLTGHPYGTNSDLAYAIRCSLMLNAQVRTGAKVTNFFPDFVAGDPVMAISYDRDGVEMAIKARRLVIATGLNSPREVRNQEGVPGAMTFSQFMAKMDGPHPLRGMKRVAVVGGGDSARSVIEALIGQGPSSTASSLDHVDKIDWYGAPTTSCEDWLRTQRKRYAAIALEMPSEVSTRPSARIVPLFGRVESVAKGYDGSVVINTNRYDAAIVAIGSIVVMPEAGYSWSRVRDYGVTLGLRFDGRSAYRVGPAAEIEFSVDEENSYGSRPENAVAIFRYAERTAAIAAFTEEQDRQNSY